jgi:D-alanyl-D-alanine carboxypeptidase/D-alanyl-D-alanine-endopeptidase (penicillin-binding protein 4)
MPAMNRILGIALSASILSACATAPRPQKPAPLAATIDHLIAAPPFANAIWGIEVEDDAGEVVYAHNAHTLLMPASNRKLFSAATDANCIGLDSQLATELWLDGSDVVIRGDGDPSFGSDRHASQGFQPFIAELQRRGVRSVHDVVADVSRFDRVTIPGSWKVQNLPSDYSAPVDALAFDENAISEESVPDAAIWAATQFREALVDSGIAVTGRIRVLTRADAQATARPRGERIATVQSPMVAQLLASVLKNSQNLYAEMLFKRSSPSGSYDESQTLERRFAIDEAHVAADEFRLLDGCGLSPDDLVTPAALVKILRWMNSPERRGIWWMTLAEPAGEGTLRRRLTNLAQRMRGKTGTINGVNALSGIVTGEKGGYRYFSILVNHHIADSSDATRVIDAIVQEIARF